MAAAPSSDAEPETAEAEAPTARSEAGGSSAKASPATNPSWRVQVDPPPAEQAVAIPADPSRPLLIPATYGLDGAVLFPSTPSPFVCLGGNKAADQKREVYDLRDGKQIGRLSGNLDVNNPLALSPDGRYLAGYAFAQPRATVVWSTADAKQVGTIKETQSPATYVDFVGPTEILITAAPWKRLEIWDFQSGQKVREIPTADGWAWTDKALALSPGRRYLVLGYDSDARLRIHDLTTGRVDAELELPREGTNTPSIQGTAFSADGKWLSALVELGDDYHLLTWDVSNGQQAADLTITGAEAFGGSASYDKHNLQWLPDASGWLVKNQYLVERQTGQKVWTVPMDKLKLKQPPSERKMLDSTHMLMVVEQDRQNILTVNALPAEKIEAAMAAAKGGGSAADAVLPPLAAVDLRSAPRVSVPTGDVPWSVKVDPAPRLSKPLNGRGVALRAPAHELIGLVWTPSARGVAAVLSGPGGPYAAKANADQGGLPRHVERIDLAAGNSLGQVDIPPVYDLAAMSPDGSRLLLILSSGRDRLDVFQASDAKPLVGWRPSPGQAIAWAEFLDDDRVLTMDAAGTLVLWSLPDAKPVYVVEAVGAQGRPVLSPGRAVLAVFGGKQVRFLDPTNGKAMGSAALPSQEPVTAAAFRADGGELAAVCGNGLARWDLTQSGKALPLVLSPLTQKVERMFYPDADHLLLAGHWLYNLPRQRVTWVFQNGMTAPTSPDGALWLASASQNIGQAFFRAIDLPGKDVQNAESAAFAPNAQALLSPGGALAAQVEGGPPRDQEGFRNSVVELLGNRLKSVGIGVQDASSGKLVVRFTERDIPNATFDLHLNRRPGQSQSEKRSFPAKAVDWELFLADSAGPPIPIASHKGGAGGAGLINIPPGETDLEGVIRLRRFEATRDRSLAAVDLPYFVQRGPGGKALIVPGTTDLGFPVTTFESLVPTYREVAVPPGP